MARKTGAPKAPPAGPGPTSVGLKEMAGPPADPEKEALVLRVAQLEAILAGKAPASQLFDAPRGAEGDYWLVKLQHVRDHVVRAKDPANAWQVYCQEMGVIASEYRPEIIPASRE